MADPLDPTAPVTPAPVLPPLFPASPPAAAEVPPVVEPPPPPPPPPVVQTEEEKEAEAAAAKKQAAKDAEKAKQKSSHMVSIVGGKPAKGIAASTGNDGVVIPRDGVLTLALVETLNPSAVHYPGLDANCVARLPDGSEIGDLVEVYCMPGSTGPSAFIHPPVDESIGILPVSTGDNVGTGVEVPSTAGRSFRKVSAANWQVLGG